MFELMGAYVFFMYICWIRACMRKSKVTSQSYGELRALPNSSYKDFLKIPLLGILSGGVVVPILLEPKMLY